MNSEKFEILDKLFPPRDDGDKRKLFSVIIEEEVSVRHWSTDLPIDVEERINQTCKMDWDEDSL